MMFSPMHNFKGTVRGFTVTTPTETKAVKGVVLRLATGYRLVISYAEYLNEVTHVTVDGKTFEVPEGGVTNVQGASSVVFIEVG